MENLRFKVSEGKLIIEIDLSVDLGPSSTGGSNFVAKTGGWMRLNLMGEGVEGRDLRLNLNLTDVPPKTHRAQPGERGKGWAGFDWRKQMGVD